jgi:hypothetical protein
MSANDMRGIGKQKKKVHMTTEDAIEQEESVNRFVVPTT